MSWRARTVEWRPAARHDLRKLDAVLVRRVVHAVDLFATSGDGDVKRLQGVDHRWRLRVGDWRVIFTLDVPGQLLVMIVLRVHPRGSAYR